MLAHGVAGVSGLRASAARRRSGSQAKPCTPRCEASADPELELRKLPFLNRPPTGEGRRRALLGELAMLNARLSGGKPHEVRQRVEWIALRRRNWELITDYLSRTDAAVTLSLIETANAKARRISRAGLARVVSGGACTRRSASASRTGACGRCFAPGEARARRLTRVELCRQVKEQLSERARGSASVADLVMQLETLQSQVAEAQDRATVIVRAQAAEADTLCSSPRAAHARRPPPRPLPRRKRA